VTLRFERPDDRRLVAHLREGDVATEVTGWNPAQSAAALLSALDAVAAGGYGECFWHEPTGQTWWMFRLVDRRPEVAVMWTAGAPANGNMCSDRQTSSVTCAGWCTLNCDDKSFHHEALYFFTVCF
jgi:hypothetical protein